MKLTLKSTPMYGFNDIGKSNNVTRVKSKFRLKSSYIIGHNYRKSAGNRR